MKVESEAFSQQTRFTVFFKEHDIGTLIAKYARRRRRYP